MTPGVTRGLQSVCENAGEGRAGLSPGCFLLLVGAPGVSVPPDPRYVCQPHGAQGLWEEGRALDLARSFAKMTDGGEPRGPVTACWPFLTVRGGVAQIAASPSSCPGLVPRLFLPPSQTESWGAATRDRKALFLWTRARAPFLPRPRLALASFQPFRMGGALENPINVPGDGV